MDKSDDDDESNDLPAVSQLLRDSINFWQKAAQLALDKKTRTIFEINAITATIYMNTANNRPNQTQLPNKIHSDAFHKAADLFKDSIHLRRDCLEQAALLGDAQLIDSDITKMFRLLEKISKEDQVEIILPELRMIDGFQEVEQRPLFVEWLSRLT